MKAIRTLFVIADHKSARFVENVGVGKGITAVDIPDLKASVETEHQSPPGRAHDSVGNRRHKLEAHQNQSVSKFTADLLDRLDILQIQGSYDRLVICMAPHMLGEIRNAMKPDLKKFVYAELNKDLVHTKLNDLPKHFKDFVAI